MRIPGALRIFLAAMLVAGLALPAVAQAQKAKEADRDEAGHEMAVARRDVPAAVLAAFAKAYPNAKIIGYSKETDEGQTVYEIESTEGTIHRDVTYAADGALVSVEETMDLAAMPVAVQQAVNKKFPGGKIAKSEKVTKGARVAYEFEIEFKGKIVEIVFDAAGKETKI
jgi:hypothetical protein